MEKNPSNILLLQSMNDNRSSLLSTVSVILPFCALNLSFVQQVSIGHGYNSASASSTFSSSVDPLVNPVTCSTINRPGATTDSYPRRSSRSPTLYHSPLNVYAQDISPDYSHFYRNSRGLSQFNPNHYYNQYFSHYMRSNEFNSLQSILPHLDSPNPYADNLPAHHQHPLSNLGHPYDYPYAYAHYSSQPSGSLSLVNAESHSYTNHLCNSGSNPHSGYFTPTKLPRCTSNSSNNNNNNCCNNTNGSSNSNSGNNLLTVSGNSISPNSAGSNPPGFLDYHHGSSVSNRPQSRSRLTKLASLNGPSRRERTLNGDGELDQPAARSTERGITEETGKTFKYKISCCYIVSSFFYPKNKVCSTMFSHTTTSLHKTHNYLRLVCWIAVN